MYTDLSFLPWAEAYALLLRMWEAREGYGLSMALRVYYQPHWRPGEPTPLPTYLPTCLPVCLPACLTACVLT